MYNLFNNYIFISRYYINVRYFNKFYKNVLLDMEISYV